MELSRWILISLIIFTIIFFIVFTLYQKRLNKIKSKEILKLKKNQLKLNDKRKKELTKIIQNLISDVLLLVDNFDPLTSTTTLAEIRISTIKKIIKLKEIHSYKELIVQEPEWINNLLINKLKDENPINWRKKYKNELEKEMKII